MSVVTTNMALRKWDQNNDLFNHTQLADNFQKIDVHDHSSGKGSQIPTAGLEDNAVTGAKVAANSVGSSHLQTDSVTTNKIPNNSIPVSKFVSGALTVPVVSSIPTTGLYEGMELDYSSGDYSARVVRRGAQWLPIGAPTRTQGEAPNPTSQQAPAATVSSSYWTVLEYSAGNPMTVSIPLRGIWALSADLQMYNTTTESANNRMFFTMGSTATWGVSDTTDMLRLENPSGATYRWRTQETLVTLNAGNTAKIWMSASSTFFGAPVFLGTILRARLVEALA